MKKSLLIFFLVFSKSFFSQNGFASHTTTLSSNSSLVSSCMYQDNSGKVWSGYSAALSATVAISVYNPTTTAWTIYNTSSTPAFPFKASAYCFEEDNSGNIWIGTSRGLLKFDGTTFTKYTIANGLPDTIIRSLEFSNNMLFVGTNNNGLSRFDGTNFTNYNIANGLFPINSIIGLVAENPNLIWACNSNSIVQFSYNPTFTSTNFTTTAASLLSGHYFSSLHISGNGDKWISSSMGPTKFSGGTFSYFKDMYPDNNFNAYYIGNLCEGPNGGIMYVTTNSNYKSFLIELLPGNRINYFYPKSDYSLRERITSNGSGKIFVSASPPPMTSGMINIVSFDESNYSDLEAFKNFDNVIHQNNTKCLDINRVKAKIMNRGDMHWDINGNFAAYEVPIGSSTHAGGPTGLWIGGLDASNQLHIASQTNRTRGNDFWSGPLDTLNGEADTLSAFNYDKIWKVSYTDINNFITQFNLGNVPLSYTPTPDIVNWPAHGTGNKAKNLAPFVDVNGDGIYNWQQGDYPKIKGDQTLYFIFNDKLGIHKESTGLPLGVEIHCMAYAYGCPNIINGRNELAYTTFYDYKIYNRSNNNYHDVYISQWCDANLGNYIDDYIGSSVHDNLGFVYNADSDDENNLDNLGYKLFPPAIGSALLKGPLANAGDFRDNDNDSIIDEPGEECLMSGFNYHMSQNFQFPQWHLTTPYRYHNYMEGRWYDSTYFTCGGDAYGGTTPTKFVYPWMNYQYNPCASNWNEISAGNLPGDRRYIVSSGPFNLPSKGQTEFELALVWSVDSSATSNVNIASANKLIQDARKIRSFYNGAIPNCLQKINIGIKENESINHLISLYPNPAQSYLQIKSDVDFGKCNYTIIDVTGRTIRAGNLNDLNQSIININELNAGIYFLNLNFGNNQSAIKKFVKQ